MKSEWSSRGWPPTGYAGSNLGAIRPRAAPEYTKAVTIDVGESYWQSTAAAVPQGDIVHAPFQLIRYLNTALICIRKTELHQRWLAGNRRLLATKYQWLYGTENLLERQQAAFDTLKASKLKTSHAWWLKGVFRKICQCASVKEDWEYFASWYSWAIRSLREPVKKVARTFNGISRIS